MRADLWRALRPTLAAAAALLATAGAAIGLAWDRSDQLAATQAERERASNASFLALQRMRGELADARSHEQRYRDLVAVGAVGPWDKLETVDRLEAALRRFPRTLVGDYAVTRALGTFPVGTEAAEGHQYREVTASLALRPRHEEELVDIVGSALDAGLQRGDVAACDIRRDDGDEGLRAACSLVWHGFERVAPAAPTDRAPADRVPADLAAAATEPPASMRDGERGRPSKGAARSPLLASPRIALGPLFFTAAERDRLVRDPSMPADRVPEPVVAALPSDRTVAGFVRRSDGDAVVWLDGLPRVLERDTDLDDTSLRLAPASRTRPLVDPEALPPRTTSGPGIATTTVASPEDAPPRDAASR